MVWRLYCLYHFLMHEVQQLLGINEYGYDHYKAYTAESLSRKGKLWP